jgi:uncharacterized protein YecT (DUF1311 family)
MRALASLIFTALLSLATAPALPAADLDALRKKFAAADAELNEVWAKLKSTLDEYEFTPVRETQRSWLSYRGVYKPGQPGPLDEEEFLENAVALTNSRTEYLRAYLRPVPEDLAGRWSDSMGGTLEVVVKGDKLYFRCEVVRGPTYHLGGITGVGTWNAPLGWFTDAGRDPGKTEVTNLAFIQRGRGLELIGANTGDYHGARAYFDGNYVKVADLPAAEAKELVKNAETDTLPEAP